MLDLITWASSSRMTLLPRHGDQGELAVDGPEAHALQTSHQATADADHLLEAWLTPTITSTDPKPETLRA